ncbi:MAG: LPS assembly protein LptD [Pseudoruegeria sp.]
MRSVRTLCLIVGLSISFPFEIQAQEAATLIADNVTLAGNNTITAQGHVEVFYDGAILNATQIIYDASTEELEILGPIVITYGDGTRVLAEQATLDTQLQNGILNSARLVLDQQLQLAAASINRIEGRYTQLNNTVASSCHVCASNPVPLWQIRATKIVHDELERQLYFEGARFEIVGVPVMYFPRLRLPDPTVERASGFLIPTVQSDSTTGVGIKIPYFIAIGDSKDLTVSPLITTETKTLEFGYRQEFVEGELDVEGAITRDKIRPDEWRGYLFADGSYGLSQDFVLNYDIEITSDKDYLLEYDYSNKDRLDSTLEVTRTRRDEYISTSYTHYRSLRESENNEEIPTEVFDATYEKQFTPGVLGGIATFNLDGHSHFRHSSEDGENGRDMARASGTLSWYRDWEMNNGMIFKTLAQGQADYFKIRQDSAFTKDQTQFLPTIGAELRWPHMKTSAGGVVHVLEPMVQLLWTGERSADVPNEDSTLIEFDEGNLFGLSRFPGFDDSEEGFRANIGATWTRYDPDGWELGVTVGKIYRDTDINNFSTGSGLSGAESDWLTAVNFGLGDNFYVVNRTLFDNGFSLTKNETRFEWIDDGIDISSSYIWMVEDSTQERYDRTSEWTLDAEYQLASNWIGKADWRYDFEAGSAATAGIGLEYFNECVSVDLSVSRRFTSTSTVDPSTNVSLKVNLLGFGSDNRRQSVSECY